MASSHVKSPGDRGYGRYHKYESMRIEWTIFFEQNFPGQKRIVADFFKNFLRNHRGFLFVIGEVFDGTTHALVSAEKYADIKVELEKKTGRSLPEVSNTSAVKIKDDGRSFPDFQTFLAFSKSLKAENDKTKFR